MDVETADSTTFLQFLLMLIAGWLQRRQTATIDYLKAENRVLRARLGGTRVIFSNGGRRQPVGKMNCGSSGSSSASTSKSSPGGHSEIAF